MKNIILIGFMGSGKSTLGKKLAHKLGYRFLDSDKEIERITGKSIPELFEESGEQHFRELEREYLKNMQPGDGVVLSTGGGMPCFHGNMELIKKLGTSFYLKLSPYELTKRLMRSPAPRPLATGKNEEELYSYVKETLTRRNAFYEQADFTLPGKKQNVTSILGLLA